MTRHRAVDDSGFTLIELLLVIVILGVVVVPLTNVIISYLRNTTSVSTRLSESHDAQIAAAYFGQDVASLGTRATAAPTASLAPSVFTDNSSGAYPCGPTGTLVRLIADDVPGGTPTLGYNRVAYALVTGSGQTQLHRIRCSGSSAAVSDVVAAHDIDPAVPPTVVCTSGGSPVSCAGGPTVPQQVVLTLSIKDPADTGTDYVMTLTGQRRST